MKIPTDFRWELAKPVGYSAREDVIEKAEELGQRIVYADDMMLQLDIDSEDDYNRFIQGYEILGKTLKCSNYTVQLSKSGYPHRHITVYLQHPAKSVWKRIALQACLGSHLTREALNCVNVLNDVDEPILFFENPKPKRRIEADGNWLE